jgi:starch phosphorylase
MDSQLPLVRKELYEKLPDRISRLVELSHNLWWSWHQEARDLFKMFDYPLWRSSGHNPVRMLLEISPEHVEQVARDPLFLRQYDAVMLLYDRDIRNGHLWFSNAYPNFPSQPVAYFSAEFGLHQSLPIYSGGLGVLAGDHAKEASDLGIPMIGVGFLYSQGYFTQRIPSHGWQEATYTPLNIRRSPIQPCLDEDGQQLRVRVELAAQKVEAILWQVNVGRTHLYLMDTQVPENAPWDQTLSARLYGGDREMRISQEIVLGIGGVRAVRALGIEPVVWHMNEGHSAFVVLERIRELVEQGMSFDEASEQVRRSTVFTTHTPVPAGHDAFNLPVVEKYFHDYWEQLGLKREEFLELGRVEGPWGVEFNMTTLALRMSNHRNAVSKLHGEVSRRMWHVLWPERPVEEVPIDAVTNGVHLPSWVYGPLGRLFARYLGHAWRDRHDDPELWDRLYEVPDEELWTVHVDQKRKMMGFIRERARRRHISGQMDPDQVLAAGAFLDPEALTIGFARRFATYKRATLLFHDVERLKRIIHDPYRPVQFIFAGKAHPADEAGKHLIQQIYAFAKDLSLGGRIAFIEDYDMHVARYLVQGVDVWLNTPRRPYEASGTSGMKAAINGVPNLSILDGWWVEGYNGKNGWAIDPLEDEEPAVQDAHDVAMLYQLLEDEVVPLFYRRDADGVPRGWVRVVRESIRTAAPYFCTRRMVKEYTEQFYVPAAYSREEEAPEPVTPD